MCLQDFFQLSHVRLRDGSKLWIGETDCNGHSVFLAPGPDRYRAVVAFQLDLEHVPSVSDGRLADVFLKEASNPLAHRLSPMNHRSRAACFVGTCSRG